MGEKRTRSRYHRNRRRRNRSKMLLLFVLSCAIGFLCGFSFRSNNQTVAMADSSSDAQEENWDFAVSELSQIQRTVIQPEEEKYYTSIAVESGDTLSGIASEYMDEHYASVEEYIQEVMNINGLHSNYLRQGDYITIPYYK